MQLRDFAAPASANPALQTQPRSLDWFAAADELSTREAMIEPTSAQEIRYPSCLRSLRWQMASTDTMLGRH